MEEIERDLKSDIKRNMERLSSQMRLYSNMRASYAFTRSKELYEDLAKILIKL